MVRSLIVLLAVLLAALASPCLWDHDTFAAEAEGKNDLVAVLVGRFERNPPLYYEMRLERSLQALDRDPANLDQYDNAAVAAERLGDHEQAIRIIGEKRKHLKPLPNDKDHWYRYHANLGTFYAHRALATGDTKDRLTDLTIAEREIAEAIRINPDAHFGREKYQLEAIRWLKDVCKGEKTDFFQHLLLTMKKDETEAAIKGLAGLIRLGNAWESVDVWSALGRTLGMKRNQSLAQFAFLRVEELSTAGKVSFAALPREELVRSYYGSPEQGIERENKELHKDLRQQADEWQKNRTEYMLQRLQKGRHPDWDRDFWSDWKDEPKLAVPTVGPLERISADTKAWLAFVAGVVVFAILPITVLRLLRKSKGASRA